MSTRWYPLYVKGNPQLRVFLPNFWMKLVKPHTSCPENQVQFIIPMEMTRYDVKNYLEKIYKVPVIDVRTHVQMGEIKKHKHRGYIVKDDDYRIAYVTLPKDQKFTFPDLFPTTKQEETKKDLKQLDTLKAEYQKLQYKHKDRPFIPNWFGI